MTDDLPPLRTAVKDAERVYRSAYGKHRRAEERRLEAVRAHRRAPNPMRQQRLEEATERAEEAEKAWLAARSDLFEAKRRRDMRQLARTVRLLGLCQC